MMTNRNTWLGKLNGGQLDLMWQFLQFRRAEPPTVHEIEVLESLLDSLRVMMAQKTDKNREGKTEGTEDFAELETVLNSIIVEVMGIYLEGGFEIMKGALKNDKSGAP